LTPYFLRRVESWEKVKLAGCGAEKLRSPARVLIFSSPTEILALQHAATRHLPNLAHAANVDTTKRHVHKCNNTDCASWHMGPGRLVDDESALPRYLPLRNRTIPATLGRQPDHGLGRLQDVMYPSRTTGRLSLKAYRWMVQQHAGQQQQQRDGGCSRLEILASARTPW
jgi:hypothetical protein